MRARRVVLVLVLALAGLVAAAAPARAYEFAIRARSYGQGYQLRGFRLLGADVVLGRRRFTEALSLMIWDINKSDDDRRGWHANGRGGDDDGPAIYFHGHLRLDHDFGDFASGAQALGGRSTDALDLVPELADDVIDLELLDGYLGIDGLAGGRLDLRIGRQISIETLDFFAMDGVHARMATPWRFAVEAFGGLRVRDSSPLGGASFEPDGTGGGECAEYVEGATPFSGSWRPVDRSAVITGGTFTSDLDDCPQRGVLMPTYGGAVESTGVGALWARLAYRRTVSPTVGIIGPVDRLDFPDRGFYPNDDGQAPGWAVNEERVSASAQATWRRLGPLGELRAQVTPHAALRYSLLHGIVDLATAGVALRVGPHRVAPEVSYSAPTFDGDSIFNVFASEPYTDARLRYELAPGGALRASCDGWVRWFDTGALDPADTGGAAMAEALGGGSRAAGAQLSVELRSARSSARLDAFHDDGYGGRRTGGWLSLRSRARADVVVMARLGVVDFAGDAAHADADAAGLGLRATSAGGQAGVTWELTPGVAVHLVGEETSSRIDRSQLRVTGVLDLAFHPER